MGKFSGYLVLLWLAAAPAAFAQQPSIADEDAFRALYNELLLDPSNLEKTLQYAALASKMGNYEAAAAPLERLLLTYPNATAIKLELGIVYHLLGASSLAKGYLAEVKADAAADTAQHAKADEYLAKLATPTTPVEAP